MTRWPAKLLSLFVLLLIGHGDAANAQPPLYRIGAPNPPLRDPWLTTDNGIPGTGSYYYRDYPWPSLREALQEYGLFGRRFRQRMTNSQKMSVPFNGTQPSPSEPCGPGFKDAVR